MRCLSLSAPWFDHVVFGPKVIENRTWATKHRGKILIHAALSYDTSEVARKAFDVFPCYSAMLAGMIIGQAEIVEIITPEEALKKFPDQKRFIFGPKCWVLKNRRALKTPIRYRGRVGLFQTEVTITEDMLCEPR